MTTSDSTIIPQNFMPQPLADILADYVELHHNGSLRQILYLYLDEGWRLFPICWFDENGNCACGYRSREGLPHLGNNIGKSPFTPHGKDDASQFKHVINQWLQRYPKANWAGWFPNMLVLDVDVRNGKQGMASLQRLKHDIALPPTRTHISGSGGLHIIFKIPSGMKIRASGLRGYADIDVKINGYVVLPPSPHVSGGVYRVQD